MDLSTRLKFNDVRDFRRVAPFVFVDLVVLTICMFCV